MTASNEDDVDGQARRGLLPPESVLSGDAASATVTAVAMTRAQTRRASTEQQQQQQQPVQIKGKPATGRRRAGKKMKLFGVSVSCALIPLLLLFVVFPLLCFFCPSVMEHLFYLNFRRLPYRNYTDPRGNGVENPARALYLDSDAEIQLGVWHVLPSGYQYDPKDDAAFDEALAADDQIVVVYAHGNSFDRTIEHRVGLYNVLAAAGCHVIAFDYRGYGDSTGEPSEAGLVNDTRTVYEWALKRAGRNPVFVWGHSMGTGVSAKLVMDLSLESRPPVGLVLESAFNNLEDAVNNHPFSWPFRWWPRRLFNYLVLNPLRSAGLCMDSDERIALVTAPILLLHAEDDHVVPVILGRRLRDAALNSRRAPFVDYIEFESAREYRHKFIYTDPELATHFRNFAAKAILLRKQNAVRPVA